MPSLDLNPAREDRPYTCAIGRFERARRSNQTRSAGTARRSQAKEGSDVERTKRWIALLISGVALSAAACGGSTPSVASPVATAATSPKGSILVSPSAAPASPSAASNASPSLSPITGVSWTFGGSLPPGWTEEDGSFSRSEKAYVEVLTDRSLMAADCALGPQPGIGHTAADIVGALSRRPGLAATAATDVTVAGLKGRQIDFVIAPGWKKGCDWWDDPKAPVVPLIGTFDDKNYWLYNAVSKGDQYRYVVLDTPDGGNAVIAITAVDPERLQEVVGPAMNIVHGLQYHLRN
jgi:hypothetical protein